jgi:hypothetical protein
MIRFAALGLLAVGLAIAIFSATASGHQVITAVSPAAQQPVGTFTMQMVASDFNPAFLDEIGGVSAADYQGRWELALDGQGHYLATSDNQLLKIEGLYSLTPEQLVFYGGKWSASCANTGDMGRRPYHAPGAYNWSFDGKTLALTTISEDCAARKMVLQSHALTLVAPE